MKPKKPTPAQLRYLIGIHRDENILRPVALGGSYGDLDVLQRLKDAGWVEMRPDGTPQLTEAGLAAIPREKR